jgi:hypothetical protein
MQDLRYPIGKCPSKPVLTPDERRQAIEAIAETPNRLKTAIAGLSPDQLDTPYRPGGWTVRQLVLTEDEPTIKPYDEALWAKLNDSQETPIEVSLTLLEALHKRWITLLRGMHPEDFARRLKHPERGTMTLDDALTTYSWHGKHHVAHITSLRHRMSW